MGLLHSLNAYLPKSDIEKEFKLRFLQLLNEDHPFERKNTQRHFTASCWVTNTRLDSVLLLHHVKLDRWLQPGGHADGEKNLLNVAIKELEEETGITSFVNVDDKIFDLDIHMIPERKSILSHEHFDVRFHFIVEDNLSLLINEESKAIKWVDLEEVLLTTEGEESFKRMITKTKNMLP